MGKVRGSAGKALYRTHRSHDFDEVVGQDHVVKTLRQAIADERVAHAYLFTGPRGVGKTSVARILAHAINGQPYSGEDFQLDIIEIDAASNRGIDEIRELRDKVHVAPAAARYKVYIIDEVHMLTTPAFNALLKTLEEPPAHAVFVLATTEAHKVPETITSRTQRFAFKPIGLATMVKHLADIATKEKISVSKPALELMAGHAKGSLRDAIGFLDQLRGSSQVEVADVVQLLGLAPAEQLDKLTESIVLGDVAAILTNLKTLYSAGSSPAQIAAQLMDAERQQLQAGQAANLALVEALLQVATAREPGLMLEVVLCRQALDHGQSQTTSGQSIATETPVAEVKSPPTDTSKSKPLAASPSSSTPNLPNPTKIDAKPQDTQVRELSSGQWGEVLAQVKSHNNSLYAVLRLARVEHRGERLKLAFAFDFHKARAEEERNRQLVESLVKEVLGQPVTIQVIIDKNLQAKPAEPDTLMSVIGVMGGGSVVKYEDG